MFWKVLIPFLRPLVPVAIDYARSKMQTAQEANARAATDQTVDTLETRLLEAESRIEILSTICRQYGDEITRLSAELNVRMKSARAWAAVLLAWNLILTLLVIWMMR